MEAPGTRSRCLGSPSRRLQVHSVYGGAMRNSGWSGATQRQRQLEMSLRWRPAPRSRASSPGVQASRVRFDERSSPRPRMRAHPDFRGEVSFAVNPANADGQPVEGPERVPCRESGGVRERDRSTRHTVGPLRDTIDSPDLSGEGDHVRRVPDELERRWLVEPIRDHREGTVPLDLHEGAGVRQRRRTRLVADLEVPLRQGIQSATAAKFHVDQEASARSHLRRRERLWPERQ